MKGVAASAAGAAMIEARTINYRPLVLMVAGRATYRSTSCAPGTTSKVTSGGDSGARFALEVVEKHDIRTFAFANEESGVAASFLPAGSRSRTCRSAPAKEDFRQITNCERFRGSDLRDLSRSAACDEPRRVVA